MSSLAPDRPDIARIAAETPLVGDNSDDDERPKDRTTFKYHPKKNGYPVSEVRLPSIMELISPELNYLRRLSEGEPIKDPPNRGVEDTLANTALGIYKMVPSKDHPHEVLAPLESPQRARPKICWGYRIYDL
jgi:hypothetical protein